MVGKNVRNKRRVTHRLAVSRYGLSNVTDGEENVCDCKCECVIERKMAVHFVFIALTSTSKSSEASISLAP